MATCKVGAGFGNPCGKPATHLYAYETRRGSVTFTDSFPVCTEHAYSDLAKVNGSTVTVTLLGGK